MNYVQFLLTRSFLEQPWVEQLGWTLLQFLWQGLLIAALFALVSRVFGRSLSANARYILACVALGAMALAPILTFTLTQDAVRLVASPPVASPAANLIANPSPVTQQETLWQRASPWLVGAWLLGVIVFSIRLIGGWLFAARMRSGQNREAPREWQQTVDRLIDRIGVSRPVQLLVSSVVEVPTVIGWLRPVVLVPVGALTGLPPAHVEALLAHELAHIRRNDYLVNLLQSLIESVLFYHPAVWWVSRQVRAERELSCDDVAVAASGDALTYAHALAGLESCRPSHVNAIAANGGSLLFRIRRLLGQPGSHTLPGPGAAWALTVVLLAGIGAVAVHGAQDPAAGAKAAGGPTVNRAEIWMDTVKQGDLKREVRGLGVLTSGTTAELKIAPSQAKELRPGQAVLIDQRTPKLSVGKVVRIRPGVANGLVSVDVQIESLAEGALPNSQVDGTIQIGSLSNVFFVGRTVAAQEDGEESVFRLDADGQQAIRVKVKYGRTSINAIQIVSGLAPGDKIILSDMSRYKEYDRIVLH